MPQQSRVMSKGKRKRKEREIKIGRQTDKPTDRQANKRKNAGL